MASAKLHAATFACETPKVFEALIDVLSEKPAYSTIVIHAPIGYRDKRGDPARTCDRDARKLLGRRHGAIGTAPTYETLADGKLKNAHLDAATMVMLPRYQEVFTEMSPFRQRTLYSGHPELSFYRLNGDKPLSYSKSGFTGSEERRRLLEAKIQSFRNVLNGEALGIPRKYLLDAGALLWTARLVFSHGAKRLPADAEWDSEGLRTEIVY
ncbi:MAG: DUF429 domain-containing protein [Actinomycetales bacterium]|nr:DUF429 domain-containing protein [Actinomycetales bacterium]